MPSRQKFWTLLLFVAVMVAISLVSYANQLALERRVSSLEQEITLMDQATQATRR